MQNPAKSGTRASVLLTAFTLMASAWLGGTAHAAFPGSDGRIAYSDGITWRVFTMMPDGQGRHAITTPDFASFAPAFNANGTRLVMWESVHQAGVFALTMDPDGSHVTAIHRLRVGGDGFGTFGRMTWSPDGSKIAFCAERIASLTSSVYVMDADGTNWKRLTTAGHSDCDPAWSPDGSRIAIDTSYRQAAHVSRIVTMKPDGTDRRVIVAAGRNFWPDWSPDGAHLVFERMNGTHFDVYTIGVGGAGLTNLTRSPNRSEVTPAYSPSGTRIAYVLRLQGLQHDGPGDLWTMNADGGGQTQLTNTPDRDESAPSWQPA